MFFFTKEVVAEKKVRYFLSQQYMFNKLRKKINKNRQQCCQSKRFTIHTLNWLKTKNQEKLL